MMTLGRDVKMTLFPLLPELSNEERRSGDRGGGKSAGVVEDLEAAKAFFVELGMELEGQRPLEGRWVDLVVGLENVRCEIAMMRIPDGHGRVELTKFHTPSAVRAEPQNAPVNTLGIRRLMFAVDDIDDVLARLRTHGAEMVGEVAQYEDLYRLCFIRGPEGIILALAEKLG